MKHTAQVQRNRALLDITTFDEAKRTIEVVFATDTPVLTYVNYERAYEVLTFDQSNIRLDRLKAGAPVLDNHSRWSVSGVLGVVEDAWVDGNTGRARLRLSDREEIKGTIKDIQDGILRQISVGYRVHKYELVKGGDEELSTYRAIDWEPTEISFAPVPADYKAGTRNAGEEHEVEIIINSNKRSEMAKEPEAPVAQEQTRSAEPPVNVEAERKAAADAERKRSADILDVCRAAKLGDDFAQKHIQAGTAIDEVRKLVIEQWAKGDPLEGTRSAQPQVKADEADKYRAAASTALALRSAQVQEKEFKADELSAAREFRGMSLLDMAREALERDGVKTRGMDKMEVAERALSSSASDFAVLLQGSTHRVLLANYAAAADTWRRFCAVGSVSDFRDHERLRMGSFSRLEKQTEHGEYRNKKFSDADVEKVRAETFGNIINVTRKMIVNDDLGFIARLAPMLGRAAARSIEIDVYELLNSNPKMGDGKSLFHADHGNLIPGVAMSVEGFDKMRVAMATQKEKDKNDFLDLRPSILLCPIGLGGEARVLNESKYDPTSGTLQKPNKVLGLFSDIVDTARLAGTAHYAFANPSEEPVLEVSFLDGVQTPFLETEQSFDTDGVRWKIRLDYGVGAIGWRGAVKNPGA